jgi:hypothetical protein
MNGRFLCNKNKPEPNNTVHKAGRYWWYANSGFPFRNFVSFGQERSPKSAPTTFTNRYGLIDDWQ